MREIIINNEDSNQTIEKYIKKLLVNAPLSFIYKLFRKNDIKINNKKCGLKDKIYENDTIKIYISDEQFDEFVLNKIVRGSDRIKRYIVYEDNNIIVVNKPTKMLVQSNSKHELSLTEMMQEYTYFENPNKKDFIFFYSPVHRIDRNTSGLVIFAKNIMTVQKLNEVFKYHDEIEKHYLALVNGVIKNDGIIDLPLKKNNKENIVKVSKSDGQESITKYKVIKSYSKYTLLDVNILTGRTHQIRAHMLAVHHPIVGDPKYGDFNENKYFAKHYHLSHQFLHSYKIIFRIKSGELTYLNDLNLSCPLDDKLQQILDSLH